MTKIAIETAIEQGRGEGDDVVGGVWNELDTIL